MELQILFSITVFFFTFFSLFTKFRSSGTNGCNLPPQPWKLPLIGHLHHLLGSLPHHAVTNLAKTLGPIIHLQLGEINAVIISSPELAKQVMKTNDLSFVNRPKLLTAEIVGYDYTDIAFSPYGEYWRQMRKISLLELLSAKKVKLFASIREEESWNLVESIVNKGRVTINLTEKVFTATNAIACRLAFGSRNKDQRMFVELIQQIVSLSGGFDVSDLFPSYKVLHMVTGMKKKLVNIRQKIDKVLDDVISDHQEGLGGADGTYQNKDLLDVLLKLKDDGGLQFPLTYDNIKAIILDVFAAGTDTSSVITDWTMFELMLNPRIMEKLQTEIRRVLKGKKMVCDSDIKELDYLRLVIKETLRLHPPLPLLLPRECREKCKIGGYDIPIGTKVIINYGKLGRDPDYWKNPESFIPERFDDNLTHYKGTHFEYIPFGAGRRMCPGLTLGMANVELFLARLLYHFNWELPNGKKPEDLDRSEAFGATLKRKHNLYLVPSVYNTN